MKHPRIFKVVLVAMLFVCIAGVGLKRWDDTHHASEQEFYKTDEGKIAKKFENQLEPMSVEPTFAKGYMFVTNDLLVGRINRISGTVFFDYYGGSEGEKAIHAFSRYIVELYSNNEKGQRAKERAYILEYYVCEKTLPKDWKKYVK